MRQHHRWFYVALIAVTIVTLPMLHARPAYAGPSNAPLVTTIYGDVRDGRAKTPTTVVPNDLPPVAGAVVSIAALGASAVTDARGKFVMVNISVPSALLSQPRYAKVAVTTTAPGFGNWNVSNIPVYVDGTETRLYVELSAAGESRVYEPAEERTKPLRTQQQEMPSQTTKGLAAPLAAGCSGYSAQRMPPGQLRLYRTATGTIETVNFNYYVRGVIPREWSPGSPVESLKAGALAIREYSWYWINNWRGGTVAGACYDLSDDPNSYQAYDPTRATSTTDNAVSAMWDWKMTSGGLVFDAQYRSGVPGEACGANATGSVMYQEGSVTCANPPNNLAWWQIIDKYYYPIGRPTIGEGPAATATNDATRNYLDVFVRADNGNIYQTYRRNGTWYPWLNLGAPPPTAVSDPGAAWSRSGDQVDISVRGNDGHLWNLRWDSVNGWGVWTDLGAISLQGPGSAAIRTGVPLAHFYLDSNLEEGLMTYDGFNWTARASLGAPGGLNNATLPWRPAGAYAKPTASDELHTFAVSNDIDNGLYRNVSADYGSTWLGWTSHGGKTASAPSATAWTSGQEIDAFVRGLDDAIYRINWNGTWQPWTTLGAPPSGSGSGPGTTWANLDSELDVFVRGEDNHLYWRQLISGSWTGWSDLGVYP